MVYRVYLGLIVTSVCVCNCLGSAVPTQQPPQLEANGCLFSAALVSETTSPQGPGLLVQVVTSDNEGLTQFDKEIPGISLSTECVGERFQKCNILEVLNQFLVVPASENLVTIDLQSSEAVPVVHELSCDPINVFFDSSRSYLWVICISGSSLNHIAFAASIGADGTLALQMDDGANPNTLVHFSTSFSETFMVSNAVCSGEDTVELYTVVDASTVWHFPITMGSNPNFHHLDEQLQNCDSVSYIEHSGMDESFTAHCSNGVSTEVSTCTQDFSPANFENSTRFSCSERYLYYGHDSVTVTFSNESIAADITHSLGPIQRGLCKDHFFLAITANGSLWVVHLDMGTVTMVVGSVCEGGGNTSCLAPSFGSENGFLVYDTAESSLKSVHILPDCGTPAVETYPDSALVEPLLYLSRGSTHECNRECRVDVATTMGAQADDTTSTDKVEVFTPQTGGGGGGSGGPTVDAANFDVQKVFTHIVIPIFLGTALILAVLTVIVLAITKPCRKDRESRCRSKGNDVALSSVDPSNGDLEFKEADSADVSRANSSLKLVNQDEEGPAHPPPPSVSPSPQENHVDYLSHAAAPSVHVDPQNQHFQPFSAQGNGDNSHLVGKNLLLAYHQLPVSNIEEKSTELNTTDMQNDRTLKIPAVQ